MSRESLLPQDWPGGWPLSNYAILLAVLFLLVTALALLVSTESVANELATHAYLALLVGVSFRLVELVAEDVLRRGFVQALSLLHGAVSSVGSILIARSGLGGSPDSRPARLKQRAWNRRIARLTFAGTAVGGLVIVVLRSNDPATLLSETFLTGWTLTLWIAGSVYMGSRSGS